MKLIFLLLKRDYFPRVILLFLLAVLGCLILARIFVYSEDISKLRQNEILFKEESAKQESFSRYSRFIHDNYRGSHKGRIPRNFDKKYKSGGKYQIYFSYFDKYAVNKLTRQFITSENLPVSHKISPLDENSGNQQVYQIEFSKKTVPWIRIRVHVLGENVDSNVLDSSDRNSSKVGSPTRPGNLVKLAIVMDDLGNNIEIFKKLLELDFDITYSIMPLRRYSRQMANLANEAGREVVLHLPMQPKDLNRFNPGQGALFVGDPAEEIQMKLELNFESVPFAKGANNHMGSAFTQDPLGLNIVMQFLQSRGMFFMDSKTSPGNIAKTAAQKYRLPFLSRDIFLDNERNREYIVKQLLKAVKISKKHGSAIIIAHPYPVTYRTLAEYLPKLERQGINITRASEIIF